MTPLLRQQISTQVSMLGERDGDGLYNSPVYTQCIPASQARQWQGGEVGEGRCQSRGARDAAGRTWASCASLATITCNASVEGARTSWEDGKARQDARLTGALRAGRNNAH